MSTRQLYIDGAGIVSIVDSANATNARLDPYGNLNDVYFHTALNYLQIKETIGPVNITLPSVPRSFKSYSFAPTVEIFNSVVTTHLVGTTSVVDPLLFLEINNVDVVGTYLIQTVGLSKRYVFPTRAGNQIRLVSFSIVYKSQLPQLTVPVTVFVAE